MWIYRPLLCFVMILICWNSTHGLEREIEVMCLDPKALEIRGGGVVANCASQGFTRFKTMNDWLFELSEVAYLQAVNASHNHLKQVVVFPVLPRVLSLTLDHNSIRDMEPLAFTGLENLQNLDLSYNMITGETLKGVLVGKKITERYEPLPIRMLFLSHNDIKSLEPSVLEHLQYLRDLHLDYNPLVVDENFTAALHKLPELKLLNLAGAGLSSLPKDAFSGLGLTSLLLNGNQFTQVPDLSSLEGSLRLLNINQNPIEELDSKSFLGMNMLGEIIVSGMPILSKIGAGTFSDLESIKIVRASYNPQLSYIDSKAFWNHKLSNRFSLQEVYLNNNALPELNKFVLPWLKITKVTLNGNKWVCDCRLHWLVGLLKMRNTAIDRITELKCWEPNWLNGTQLVFWKIDSNNRLENYYCQKEQEQERLEQERLAQEYSERERLKTLKDASPPQSTEETQASSSKLYHIIIIAGIISVVLLIGAIIAFNKYRNYRPIYNVEKMSSSPMHNEMKYMNGNMAEKTQLVS